MQDLQILSNWSLANSSLSALTLKATTDTTDREARARPVMSIDDEDEDSVIGSNSVLARLSSGFPARMRLEGPQ